jgi:histidine triad (HIT) family protein
MSEDTIFGKIIRKEIPAEIVFESENVVAFRDVNPQAPTHILIVPRKTIANLDSVVPADKEILGEILLVARELARKEGLSRRGYRVVINCGLEGGQTVFHLHFHLMGGRAFDWPPG